MKGLIPAISSMPKLYHPDSQDESEDQSAQTMESVLKKRREKIAQDKGISPEGEPEV